MSAWRDARDDQIYEGQAKVRSAIEHIFAHQKGLTGLMIRIIGLVRAGVKIGLVNLSYNIRRFVWLQTQRAPG
jgi:IS5 family transposase